MKNHTRKLSPMSPKEAKHVIEISKRDPEPTKILTSGSYENQELAKTAAKISRTIQNNKKKAKTTKPLTDQQILVVNGIPIKTLKKHGPIKIIRPMGYVRPEPKVNDTKRYETIDSFNKTEDEALSNILIDQTTFAKVQKIAQSNPITKELIEDAKRLTHENKAVSEQQFQDLVALYNVKHNKAFFYITAAEARLAIDHIKKLREGFIDNQKEQDEKDQVIFNFIKCMPKLDILNVPLTPLDKLTEILKSQGVEIVQMPDSNENGISNKSVHELIKDTNINRKDFAPSIKNKLEEIDKKEENQFHTLNTISPFEEDRALTLDWLNKVLAYIEASDLNVDAILMHSLRIADVRSWGESVYTQYSRKERIKRQCFGNIWGAEIYPCNILKQQQIVFVSFSNTAFPSFTRLEGKSKITNPIMINVQAPSQHDGIVNDKIY